MAYQDKLEVQARQVHQESPEVLELKANRDYLELTERLD